LYHGARLPDSRSDYETKRDHGVCINEEEKEKEEEEATAASEAPLRRPSRQCSQSRPSLPLGWLGSNWSPTPQNRGSPFNHDRDPLSIEVPITRL